MQVHGITTVIVKDELSGITKKWVRKTYYTAKGAAFWVGFLVSPQNEDQWTSFQRDGKIIQFIQYAFLNTDKYHTWIHGSTVNIRIR